MAFITLLRPKQWSKNLLVFAAILFTNGFRDPRADLRAILAFVAMCLISSSVYVFNDIRDAERDRAHPRKKSRPIASGRIKPATAALVGMATLLIAAVILIWLGKKSVAVVALYALLQVGYNLGGKSVPVLDVFLIASGFVMRAALGAAAINVKISAWLLLCTGALALLLGFAKRRNEFILQGDSRTTSRESLAGYSKESLDALVIISATAAALCYGIYALQSPTAQRYPGLFLTTIFVFYGITRYVLIVFVNDEGGEPESILFKDPHIWASVLLFVAASVIAVSVRDFPLIEFTRPGGIK